MDIEIVANKEEPTHIYKEDEDAFYQLDLCKETRTNFIEKSTTQAKEVKESSGGFQIPDLSNNSEEMAMNYQKPLSKYQEFLFMELDPNSDVRNTYQQECLRYMNLNSFVLTPLKAIDRRSLRLPIEELIERETKQQKPRENEFIVGSNPETGDQRVAIVDPTVSSAHAKIIYKDFYAPYFTFMLSQIKICQMSTGKASLIKKIPSEIHRKILEFAGPKVSFYIEDNGSQKGTFELISEVKPKVSLSGQEIQISADTTILILQVSNKKFESGKIFDSKKENILKKLVKEDKAIIIGSNALSQRLESECDDENDDFDKKNYDETRNLKWEDNFELSVPFMKLEVRGKMGRTFRYIILPEDKTTFSVGRNNKDADIPVCSVLCSRKHCEIKYDFMSGCWTVNDGSQGKSSLAGTWNSLQTIQERKEKKKSKQTPITDGSLFKLGESIFRFSYKKIKYTTSFNL